MPLYFFDIHDSRDYLDDHGTELPNIVAAMTEGMERISDILEREAALRHLHAKWTLEILNEDHEPLLTVEFTLHAGLNHIPKPQLA